MSPRGLSRPRHTEFAGTMEMDEFAGPYGQFRAFFFFPSPVHFLSSVGGGKKGIFKKDKPTLGVKKKNKQQKTSLLIDFTTSVWAL